MIVVAVLAVLFVVYLIIDNPLGTLIFILFAVLLCAAVALLPGISEKRNRVLKIEKKQKFNKSRRTFSFGVIRNGKS